MTMELETILELEREPSPDRAVLSSEPVRCTAELAECTCPDFCERDHANE
jgi:hypothetical protein